MAFYAGFVTGVLVLLAGLGLVLVAVVLGAGRLSRRQQTARPSVGVSPPLAARPAAPAAPSEVR